MTFVKTLRWIVVSFACALIFATVTTPADSFPVVIVGSANWVQQDLNELNSATNTFNSYQQLLKEVAAAKQELVQATSFLNISKDATLLSGSYATFYSQNPNTASVQVANSIIGGSEGMLNATDITKVENELLSASSGVSATTAAGDASLLGTKAIYQADIFQADQEQQRAYDLFASTIHRQQLLDLSQYNIYTSSFNDYTSNFQL